MSRLRITAIIALAAVTLVLLDGFTSHGQAVAACYNGRCY